MNARATRVLSLVACVSLCAAGTAIAQVAGTGPVRTGYLGPAGLPDLTRVLPPPPEAGDSRDAADLAVFKETRKLEGTARWSLAQSDNNIGTAPLLNAFSCAMDLKIVPDDAPTLAKLLSQASFDAGVASNRAKDAFGRKRPYQRETGNVCLTPQQIQNLARSADYPSGHATAGWMAGRLLAELEPDRATEILWRARVYGESRVVCGVHHVTAVEAGRTSAEAVLAALHGSAAFRADLDAARQELQRLRESSQAKPATCDAERVALLPRPY